MPTTDKKKDNYNGPVFYTCKRCGYKWASRSRNPKRPPAVCPKCNSALWNMEKED